MHIRTNSAAWISFFTASALLAVYACGGGAGGGGTGPGPASMITVSIIPKLGGLTTSQTQVFNAMVTNDVGSAGVTWTASGGSFANQTATSVTFSSAAA